MAISKKQSTRSRMFQEMRANTGSSFSSMTKLGVGTAALLVSTFSNAALPTIVTTFLNASASSKVSNKSIASFSNSNPSVPLVGGAKYLFGGNNMVSLRLLATVVVVGGIASGVRSRLVKGAEERLEANLRDKVFTAICEGELIDVEEFALAEDFPPAPNPPPTPSSDSDQPATPTHVTSLMHVLTKQTTSASKAFTQTLSSVVRSTFSVVNSSLILISISPKLTVCSLALIPSIGTIFMIVSKIKKSFQKRLTALKLSTISEAEETLRLLQTVKTSKTSALHVSKFASRTTKILSLSSTISTLEGFYMATLFGLTGLTLGGLAYLGGEEIKAGRLAGGTGDVSRFMVHTSLIGVGAVGAVTALGEVSPQHYIAVLIQL